MAFEEFARVHVVRDGERTTFQGYGPEAIRFIRVGDQLDFEREDGVHQFAEVRPPSSPMTEPWEIVLTSPMRREP